MKKFVPVFDAGHGGIYLGNYQTPGKRSPLWPDGSQLFEGEFNRAVMSRVIELCVFNGVPYATTDTLGEADVSLTERVNIINSITRENYNNYNYYGVSIHSNATVDPHGKDAHGCEIFVHPRSSNSSKLIANCFAREYIKRFGLKMWRFGNNTTDHNEYGARELYKTANYKILRETICPMVLIENFFMDNEIECKEILLSHQGRDACAETIFKSVHNLWN